MYTSKTNHLLFTFQKYFGLFLVLFSLSSCAVKETVFNEFGISVERTLNKSKSITTCQISPLNENRVTNVCAQPQITPSPNLKSLVSLFPDDDFISSDYFETKNNSPPFYILFQRLKIAIVV